MNNDPPADDPRWLLSALADGEARGEAIAFACAAWASADGSARASWHAYHLIGDVLRSEDLANVPARDQAFLERLHLQLDAEPAVLAPQLPAMAARTQRFSGWGMPAALAAGVMGLATVLVVAIRPMGDGSAVPVLAKAPAPAVQLAASGVTMPAPVAEAVPPGGAVVRNAQLDRYLRAHRDYANALPGSLPGGPGRSVSAVSFER